MADLELNFDLDPIERLGIEIKACESPNGVAIGKYLTEQFSCDSALKNAYKTRKITLENVLKFVEECAKKKLNSKNGFIEDKEVYGWVLHYVQDEEVKIPESETFKVKNYELTEEEKEQARLDAIKKYEDEQLEKIKKKEEAAKKRQQAALEKEKKEREEHGQISLFDFDS